MAVLMLRPDPAVGGLGQRSLITDGQPVVLEIAVTEANAPEGFVYDQKLRPR